MLKKGDVASSFKAAFPIMLGYVTIGLPCGILSASIGLTPLQAFFVSILFYSGAGQFMIPNMWIAVNPIASIIFSVSWVNTRQMLYSVAFAPFCKKEKKWLTFLFAATVTDESYGVNIVNFQKEECEWSVAKATMINLLSNSSWTLSNVVGALIGNAIGIPLEVASFAMTSIFICLLLDCKLNSVNICAAVSAAVGVVVCKLIGLSGMAILFGALIGVGVALLFSIWKEKREVSAE